MDKMKMASIDMTQVNIEKIEALFPNCITETRDENGELKKAVNFEMLKQMLSPEILEGDEAYEFTWVGKKASILEANKPIRKTLRPCPEESVNWDSTENLYIEGDNLEVLKLLQESYLGKIKMIYIDPPYNTGKDFIYPDSFIMGHDEYNDGIGYFDENGDINYSRENSESAGRYHSDWCSMIYSRILLARNLLSNDGAMFISIDDNEVENLKKICNEVFGDENFIASIPWRKRTAKSDVPFGISQDYEQILCYAKSNLFSASIEGKGRKYYESEDYPNRPWRIHDLTQQKTASDRPKSNFTIINPRTREAYPANPNAVWRITVDTYNEYYKEGRIIFPGDYEFLKISKPVLRYWREDDVEKAGDSFGKVAVSTKLPDNIGMSKEGTKEIMNLFGKRVFSFPKPTSLLTFLASICVSNDDLVLDFFSGSATLAQAIMDLNVKDGGHRKYILGQVQEPCGENTDAYKAGFKNICEIGKERIRRAGKKIIEEHPEVADSLDIGFRVLKLDDSNMKDVYYNPSEYSQDLLSQMESNVKEDRTDLDLLFGCLLEWGLPLSLSYSSETMEGCTVHNYNDGDLIACFDEKIPDSVIKEIAKQKPLRAVFRDSSFADSPSKINVGEIFKLLSPDTRVKVI